MRFSHSMFLMSSLRERVFECWMDSSKFLTYELRGVKLPSPPLKSRWALIWVLDLQSGFILHCFDLEVSCFDFNFDLGVSRAWAGY